MAATVVVKEWNGAGRTETTVSVAAPARFCTSDTNAPGTSYPIVIPTSDYNYSYWKHFGLDLSGTFTKINNVRFYCDGTIAWTLGTAGAVLIAQRSSGDHGCPTANYEQSTGTEGTTGYYLFDVTNGHDYFKSGVGATPVNLTTYTSGSPCTIDSGDHTTAEDTKGACLQMKVDTDATQGEKTDETFTFLYDEI